MTPAWVARFPVRYAASLARLRTVRGIEAARLDDFVWLRGSDADEALVRRLRTLPFAERFEVLDDGRIRPVGALVPTERLPSIAWVPLTQLVEAALPVPALSGRLGSRVPLRLVPSTHEAVPNVLMVPMEIVAAFVESAPESRLHCCRLAVRADGRALVHGRPLPSIPGALFVERDGVAIPAGFECDPQVPFDIIAEALELAEGDLAILDRDAELVRIPADQFVLLTRSAVRRSQEALAGA